MTALTLIAEPFPDWEAPQHLAAARDLTIGVAATAPRACSARYLASRGAHIPEFSSPRIRAEHLPVPAKSLPLIWRSGSAARPLDGEFVHAVTPFVPLRQRDDDDGSQNTVTITHGLAWEAPELLGASQARLYRSFVRRAAKYADAILATSHSVANLLQQHYGEDLPVQVLQLATPQEFLEPVDRAERAAALGLPEQYAVTTATRGDHGRLEWIFDALRANGSLPPVVVLEGLDPTAPVKPGPKPAANAAPGEQVEEPAIPVDLAGRVLMVTPRDLSDVGAALAGASLLLQPQSYATTGYTVLGALTASVPVLHAGHPATTELVIDAGIIAETSGDFGAEFTRLMGDAEEHARYTVLALDRSRAFSWHNTAWQLWETHANL
ncbi:glycosyltransferase [Leucobacter sp. gxy201]|uniref:glycosyltransferase n=1 Tax=Leucobacter sp. gxy201 TaxID=2957200 RepID=UPI003D9FF074